MAISRQSRNIIIGAAAAVLIVAILAFLLGRGCGKEYGSTATGTTPAVTTGTTTTRTVPTDTRTTAAVVPAGPESGPVPEPGPEAVWIPEIISRSVNPEIADPGDPLTFSADVVGPASSVTITVYKRDTGDLALALPLAQGETVGDTTTWSAGAAAPAAKGVYRFLASATASDGSVVEMPGISAWTFCVGDPMVDCT